MKQRPPKDRRGVRARPRDGRRFSTPAKRRIAQLIEQATVDAYGEDEQRSGLFTMLEEHLATPFEARLLGMVVVVERVDLTEAGEIVAICRRGRARQAVPILELPLPKRRPAGAEWIDAYRSWARGE